MTKYQNISDFLDFMASSGITPGNTVRVAVGNEIVHSHTAGYADLESKAPMTGREKLYIYSCSKILLSAAALQLLEKGMFSMEEPLFNYIPEFEHMKVRGRDGNVTEAKNRILIRHLFTMTAGFSYDLGIPPIQKLRETSDGRMETLRVVRALAEEPLVFEPGTKWQYSLAHDVLAGLIEVLTGMKYRDYVRKNIFEPLEMYDSCFHADERLLSEMASLYCRTGKGRFIDLKKKNDYILGSEYDSGGAGVITTADDYIRLLSALANFGLGMNGARILAPATVDLMRSPIVTVEDYPDYSWEYLRGFAYGFGVRTLTDKAKAGYNGSTGEFGWDGAAGSNCFVDPDRHIAVFYGQHCLNPAEEYNQPRLHNIIYSCMY